MTNSHIQYRSLSGLSTLDSFLKEEGAANLPTHYPSSSKGNVAIKYMQIDHLNAAIAKLTKAPGTKATLNALLAEKASRT